MEHCSAFLDILKQAYRFSSYNQNAASFINHICLTFSNRHSHTKTPQKYNKTHYPIKPTGLSFWKKRGF